MGGSRASTGSGDSQEVLEQVAKSGEWSLHFRLKAERVDGLPEGESKKEGPVAKMHYTNMQQYGYILAGEY